MNARGRGRSLCRVSCQNSHPQALSSFGGMCDACLKWRENEMEKAYSYEAREGRWGLGIAKQKHILASKSLSAILWNTVVPKWCIPGNSSNRILNSDTSIRELSVITSSYLAQPHDHFQSGYCTDRASCISSAEENKKDVSMILLLSQVSHTTFSSKHRENNINFFSYYFICISCLRCLIPATLLPWIISWF